MPEEDRKPEQRQGLGARVEQTEQRTETAERRTMEAMRRTELAIQRTERAERRTLLANERTFSAWLRTGLASIGGGLAVVRLLGGEGLDYVLARIVGVILVTAGGVMAALALWRFTQVSQILERERLPVLPIWFAWLLAGSLVVVAALVLMLIAVG